MKQLWRTHRNPVATAAAVLLVAVAASAWLLTRPSHPTAHPSASGQMTVQAPADGNLRVADTTVRQLAGTCPTPTTCQYAPVDAADLPTVTVPAGTKKVPVAAAKSTAFTVNIFNRARPASTVHAAYAHGALLVDDLPTGHYQVSMSGSEGGVWQFQLTITLAPHSKSSPK